MARTMSSRRTSRMASLITVISLPFSCGIASLRARSGHRACSGSGLQQQSGPRATRTRWVRRIAFDPGSRQLNVTMGLGNVRLTTHPRKRCLTKGAKQRRFNHGSGDVKC